MKAVAQLSSVKLRFCKTLRILQKHLRWSPVSPQSCNSTKKDTITGVFLWMYLCEYIFSFLLFCFRKDKSSHRRCSVEKVFLEKHLCWSLFLIKLHVFKNTYFEEYLWTTTCKKINTCLIVKVLLLCKIKILNSNVNKKKKHVRKFDVRSHVTQEYL